MDLLTELEDMELELRGASERRKIEIAGAWYKYDDLKGELPLRAEEERDAEVAVANMDYGAAIDSVASRLMEGDFDHLINKLQRNMLKGNTEQDLDESVGDVIQDLKLLIFHNGAEIDTLGQQVLRRLKDLERSLDEMRDHEDDKEYPGDNNSDKNSQDVN